MSLCATAAALPAAHAQPTGDQRRSYRFADPGEDMPYRVYVPASWTAGKSLPIVLMLHGGGLDENAPFDREPPALKGSLFRLADQYGYILVAPRGYTEHGGYGSPLRPTPPPARPAGAAPASGPSGPPQLSREEAARVDALSEKDTLNVLEMVTREYGADRTRTFLMGNSMGSNGAFHLASKYPDRWLAVSPSEGFSDLARLGEALRTIKARGLLFVKKDDAQNAKAAETISTLAAQGIDARLTIVPDSRHESAWYMNLPQTFEFFDGWAKKR